MRAVEDLPFLDTECDAYIQDPFPAIAALRDGDPYGGRAFRTPRGVDFGTYDAGRAILTDKRIVSRGADHWRELGAGPLLLQYLTEGRMVAAQGERHLAHRRMLTPPLSAGAVQAQRDMYRDIAVGLVDRFAARGRCELVADFSHRYPLEILCRALGVPLEEMALFEDVTLNVGRLNSVPFAPHAPRVEATLQALSDYTADLLERRRGDRRGDFIDDLAAYEAEGRMTHLEVVWSLVTLIQAAHVTTRNQTANIVRALIEANCWNELGGNPALIPAAIEEGMRHSPVISNIPRVVGPEDVLVDGVALAAGTPVNWNAMAAGRDPERFDDPARFDLGRAAGGRTPFGFGLHKCLGHHMARSDMEVAVEVLTERLGNPRISAPVRMETTGVLWGPTALELTFG